MQHNHMNITNNQTAMGSAFEQSSEFHISNQPSVMNTGTKVDVSKVDQSGVSTAMSVGRPHKSKEHKQKTFGALSSNNVGTSEAKSSNLA